MQNEKLLKRVRRNKGTKYLGETIRQNNAATASL